MMEARKGGWCQTFTGRQFWPLDPKPEDVCVEDIAHHLSQLCRFTGASKFLYSVAEHSIRVAMEVPLEDKLWGLLNDASEAYLCDLAAPIKRCPELASYRDLEDAVQAAVCERFGLSPGMPASVKEADLRMLATEAIEVMAYPPASWGLEAVKPYDSHKLGWGIPPVEIKQQFLTFFTNLASRRLP